MTTDSPFPHGYLESTKHVVTEQLNIISGKFTAIRHFFGPWDKRFNFIFEELLVPTQYSGTTVLAVPQAYPDLPVIHVDEVSITGEGKASVNILTKAPVFDRANITVTYKAHNFQFAAESVTSVAAYQNNIFLEEEHDEYIEQINFSGDKVKVDGVLGNADDKYVFQNSKGDLVLSQKFIISPDWISLDFMKGKVNGTVFITPAGIVYAEETLRYDGYSASSRINVTNGGGEDFPLPVWDVEHRFSINKLGWNNRVNPDEWTKKVTVRDAEGVRYFRRANLNHIFLSFSDTYDVVDTDYIQTRLEAIETLMETDFPFGKPQYKIKLSEIRQKILDMGFRI